MSGSEGKVYFRYFSWRIFLKCYAFAMVLFAVSHGAGDFCPAAPSRIIPVRRKGAATCGKFPEGVNAHVQFGGGVKAMAAYLSARHMIPESLPPRRRGNVLRRFSETPPPPAPARGQASAWR